MTLSIAVLRHRLCQIDLIINRALVYGALTAILAGLYSGSISLFQKVFIALTGEKSDAAIVLTTLILASTFTPIKTRLQAVVDRRFRDTHDPLRRLAEFSKRIDGGIWVLDRRLALEKLLEESVAALDAVGGQVSWVEGGAERAVATRGEWTGDSRLTVPLAADGRLEGRITLGPRRNDATYESEDAKALTGAAEAVARALSAAANAVAARCPPRSNPPRTALADLGSLHCAEADALLRPRHSSTGLAGRSPPGAFHHASTGCQGAQVHSQRITSYC